MDNLEIDYKKAAQQLAVKHSLVKTELWLPC